MPSSGRPANEVIADLAAKRDHDVRWEDGRTFGMVYDGGPGARGRRWTADLLHGPETAAERARIERDVIATGRRTTQPWNSSGEQNRSTCKLNRTNRSLVH